MSVNNESKLPATPSSPIQCCSWLKLFIQHWMGEEGAWNFTWTTDLREVVLFPTIFSTLLSPIVAKPSKNVKQRNLQEQIFLLQDAQGQLGLEERKAKKQGAGWKKMQLSLYSCFSHVARTAWPSFTELVNNKIIFMKEFNISWDQGENGHCHLLLFIPCSLQNFYSLSPMETVKSKSILIMVQPRWHSDFNMGS